MRAAAEKLRALIDGPDPVGAKLLDLYIQRWHGEHASLPRERYLEAFRGELDWLISASTACEERGIERVGLCYFD